MSKIKKPLHRSVIMLGFISMFMDISSEIIHSLLPVFMLSVLGISVASIGVIEGIANSLASITKVFSGVISDWLGKRKVLILLGYGIAALTKPLFPLAHGITSIMAARFIDRIGKGIRGAPRDALISDVSSPGTYGAAFGLRQSMDRIGAFIGPALAIILMLYLFNDYRLVFWIAVIPAFISVAFIIFGIKEPKFKKLKEKKEFPIKKKELIKLRKPFWIVISFATFFTLMRFSEAFLLLRGDSLGLAANLTPAIFIVMNMAYAVSAYPIGKLSDKLGKLQLLAIGIFIIIIADLLLALGNNLYFIFAGAALWGLHMGMTQGLLSALIADTSPESLRGTAFGIFHLLTGVALLISSMTAGWLWSAYSPSMTFFVGAIFAITSLLLLALMRGKYFR